MYHDAVSDLLNTLDPKAVSAPWLYAPWAKSIIADKSVKTYVLWLETHKCQLVQEPVSKAWFWECGTIPHGISTTKEAKSPREKASLVIQGFMQSHPHEFQAYQALNESMARDWAARVAASSTTSSIPASPEFIPEETKEFIPAESTEFEVEPGGVASGSDSSLYGITPQRAILGVALLGGLYAAYRWSKWR